LRSLEAHAIDLERQRAEIAQEIDRLKAEMA
jgi:hypothetical protein